MNPFTILTRLTHRATLDTHTSSDGERQYWKCPAVLMIAGADYRCDVTCVDAAGAPAFGHQGWPHANKEAQAVWGEPQ